MGDRFNLDKLELEDNSDEPKIDEASLQKEAIAFSVKVVRALSDRMREHNHDNDNKVNLKDLKEVYVRGARNYPNSDKPEESCGLWALARVNMFLRIKSGDQISLSDSFEVDSEFIDISEGWIPSQEDFDRAGEEIVKFNLNYEFSTIDDLYIENYQNIDWEW